MKNLFMPLLALLQLLGHSFLLAQNPIMAGADPHVIYEGGRFWMYPTYGRGTEFYAFSSSDANRWERHGPVLKFEDVGWIYTDGRRNCSAWAPCIAARNGRWYFYYSVGPQSEEHPSRIGAAVGDGPAGPFTDCGKPLLTGGDGFEAIDPMVFEDPNSGRFYMYAGGSAGATLRVFEMNADMVSFAREVPVQTPPEFTEGAFMHWRNGRYYLSYSHGGWRDASYSVHYATSATPIGPWTYRGAILVSDEKHKGPGHHSFVQEPGSGTWCIFYHRWNERRGEGPFRGRRQIAAEKVEYDGEGLIKPIVMTDTGVVFNAAAPGI